MISETFAECLGGLVSIIGQNLKVGVETLNGSEINRCLSTGYNVKVVKKALAYEIAIDNLQSEENRDLVFELKLPKMNGKHENMPLVKLSVKYKNVIRDTEEELSN
eukprot:CAMPEP_0197045218 /NCGR_PEP_ID=MMETSP1384-20130603/21131_1 /TAXON_ID=29189 /ORGANISM="Ammonia sp." /LENGTH=105 /DNA_ID=CAMNT_0042476799 /DNA_START=30 /DNA_END=344 /DNA_ORIENTATION=-